MAIRHIEEEDEPVGVSAGAAAEAPRARLSLPDEHATALEKFYAARRLRRKPDLAASSRLLQEARRGLQSALSTVTTPAVLAALAETAASCALEAGQFREAAVLASNALTKIREAHVPEHEVELARAVARGRILGALDRAWAVDWPLLDDDDRQDLVLTRDGKRAEIVLSAEADAPSEEGLTTTRHLRLIVPMTREGCEDAAKRLSNWAAPPRQPVFASAAPDGLLVGMVAW